MYQTAIALWLCKLYKQIGYSSFFYSTYVSILFPRATIQRTSSKGIPSLRRYPV